MALKAIFYARFHPERGPSVVHQYPTHSIVTTPASGHETLLMFSNLSPYVIPPYEVCDRAFAVCMNGLRVLGFPVSLEDAKYSRNRFTYNVCFVLDEEVAPAPWQQIVRKTANLFKSLEVEDGILQAEELLEGLKWAGEEGYPVKGIGVLQSLLERVFLQLNEYGEACVRLDDPHTLNLRLEPPRLNAPKVRAWDVPLLIRTLPGKNHWTWGLTLERIYPHIDGIKHVQRIAEVADVEVELVKSTVRELLLLGRVLLLDIFHYRAVYTVTTEFTWFVKDPEMIQECLVYVLEETVRGVLLEDRSKPADSHSAELIISLYSALSSGISLYELCLAHVTDLSYVDLRRFITFGVVKGFLRRIHVYALAVEPQAASLGRESSNGARGAPSTSISAENRAMESDRPWKQAALSSGWPTPPVEPPLEGADQNGVDILAGQDEQLKSFLNGRHCLDEICAAMHMSEPQLRNKLDSGQFGEMIFFAR